MVLRSLLTVATPYISTHHIHISQLIWNIHLKNSVLQCAEVCCCMVPRVAVCSSELLYGAVCCSVQSYTYVSTHHTHISHLIWYLYPTNSVVQWAVISCCMVLCVAVCSHIHMSQHIINIFLSSSDTYVSMTQHNPYISMTQHNTYISRTQHNTYISMNV